MPDEWTKVVLLVLSVTVIASLAALGTLQVLS